jgi:hypothetical protein
MMCGLYNFLRTGKVLPLPVGGGLSFVVSRSEKIEEQSERVSSELFTVAPGSSFKAVAGSYETLVLSFSYILIM